MQAGDFEGSVVFGLGVQKQTTHRVRTSADTVVVEIGAGFPTVTRKVFFVDSDAEVAAVDRRVPAGAPAAGALHALFAGPLASERADGLRLVRSRAWGFEALRIADGIARVRLTHGCGSGGSRPRSPTRSPRRSAVPVGRLGQGLRPGRPHRAAHRADGLDPALPGALGPGPRVVLVRGVGGEACS